MKKIIIAILFSLICNTVFAQTNEENQLSAPENLRQLVKKYNSGSKREVGFNSQMLFKACKNAFLKKEYDDAFFCGLEAIGYANDCNEKNSIKDSLIVFSNLLKQDKKFELNSSSKGVLFLLQKYHCHTP